MTKILNVNLTTGCVNSLLSGLPRLLYTESCRPYTTDTVKFRRNNKGTWYGKSGG